MTTYFAPGRLEVLGKHTDYCGGNVLVMPIDRGVTVTVEPAARGIEATTDLTGETVTLERPLSERSESKALPPGHWAHYLQTAIDRLTANFGELAPCRIEVTSDLPPASGMSSSSALIVATTMALAEANGFPETDSWRRSMPTPLDLAAYLACVENGKSWGELAGDRGVGTLGGSEDHTAMICGRPGTLTQFSFDPLAEVASVPVPEGLTFVVAESGVRAEKTGSAKEAYNAASRAAGEVLSHWNAYAGRADASLAAAVRFDSEGVYAAVRGDDQLERRLHQFVRESTVLVPEAVCALERRDLATFGALVAESQGLAETHLQNQVPETIELVRSALEMGAYAASAFGAGFGGSVWALVDRSGTGEYAEGLVGAAK